MPSVPERSGMSFAELQRWFLRQVVAPDRTTKTIAPAPERDVEAVILPSNTLSSKQRMGIYSEMYLLRLVKVMEEEHPVVQRLVGKQTFHEMVRDYIGRFPPRSYYIHSLPHALPHYLTYYCKRDDAALLTDVARLERAISDAYNVDSRGTLTTEDLTRIPENAWERVCFRFDPSVRVMAFAYDVPGIVDAHHEGKALPDLSETPSWAVVWRHNYKIWRRSITSTMYTILTTLGQGESIFNALELASENWQGKKSELEGNIFQWFADWVNDGFFSSFVVSPAK